MLKEKALHEDSRKILAGLLDSRGWSVGFLGAPTYLVVELYRNRPRLAPPRR